MAEEQPEGMAVGDVNPLNERLPLYDAPNVMTCKMGGEWEKRAH